MAQEIGCRTMIDRDGTILVYATVDGDELAGATRVKLADLLLQDVDIAWTDEERLHTIGALFKLERQIAKLKSDLVSAFGPAVAQ